MNIFQSVTPEQFALLMLLVLLLLIAIWRWRCQTRKNCVRLGGLSWTPAEFCAGWLITGGTGTGKSLSGLLRLLHETCRCHPGWGGLVVDDKGHFHETLLPLARHHRREADVIVLRVAEEGPPPVHRFNLTGDPAIPCSTYARLVVDTAIALGQRSDQSFFQTQARDQIAAALAALRLLGYAVTLANAHQLLLDPSELPRVIAALRRLDSEEGARLARHFAEHYLAQPPEQLGGVQGSLANYLTPYLTPAVAAVFCRDSTFTFADLDAGKILYPALPQKFAVERRYVNTFLKQLFYHHALSRFDQPAAVRARHNLLVLWADEAQHFVTAGADGLSDYNAVDRLREARATVVLATQSVLSFGPPLGRERAEVLRLNLRNRLVFQAASAADAQDAADFLGKKRRLRRVAAPEKGPARYHEEEVYRVRPDQFRRLRPHQAVILHARKKFRRRVLPPLAANGRVAPWFRWWHPWT